MKAKADKKKLSQLQEWLSSYNSDQIFATEEGIQDAIISIILTEDVKKLRQQIDIYESYEVLTLSAWQTFDVSKDDQVSCMQICDQLLDQTFQDNSHSIRLFSSDKLVSNKLDAVLNRITRNFQWNEFSNARDDRIIKILSKHMCQEFMQDYTLIERTTLFSSYESFLGIVPTMMVQYSKFNKMVLDPRMADCCLVHLLMPIIGSRDQLAQRHFQYQLYRNLNLDAPRT